MAISTSYTFSPTAEALLRQAVQRCGVLALGRTMPVAWQTDGIQIMNTVLKSNQGRASKLTQEERTTQVVSAALGGSYTLAADTVDILEPVMLLQTNNVTEIRLPVSPWAEYGEIADKTATGQPLRVYFDRATTFQMVLDPIPDRTYTVKYRRVRLLRNAEVGMEMDLHQTWLNWLVLATAAALAPTFNLPENRVLRLEKQAEAAYKEARLGDADVGGVQFTLGMGMD